MPSVDTRSMDPNLPLSAVAPALLYRIRTAAVPPKPFSNPESEAAFIRRYQEDGMLAYSIALVIGGIALLGFFFAHAVEGVTYGSNRLVPQSIRLLVGLALLGLAYLLLTRKDWFYKHFNSIGLIGPLVALSGVALLPFTMYSSATIPGFPFARFFLSLATTIWICFAFSRASRYAILVTSALASLALVTFGIIHAFDGTYFSSMHLAVAIWAGWALSVIIERRERQVFISQERIVVESRAMAENLERADLINEMQSNALQTIAHDIRQPLLSLGLYADLVGSKYGNEPSIKDLANRIHACLKASENSVVIVENVLQSAGEASCFALKVTTLTHPLTMLDVVFSPILAARGVRLELPSASDQMTTVWTNEHALSEILLNLISNAYKHAWPQGNIAKRISLAIEHSPGFVTLIVRDNGQGIDESDLPRLFEKGFRSCQPRESSGSGLGLAIVRGLVERLPGHEISVQSHQGSGTEFRIHIPTSDPEPGSDA